MRRACPLLVGLLLLLPPAVAALPTVVHEGRAYVELARLVELLEARVEAGGSERVTLRVGPHAVIFTRNRAEALVDGRPMALGAPVRVRGGAWLVPEAAAERVARLALAAAPTLVELRYRSYPSFTRVVLETSAPLAHRVEPPAARELRVRLAALAAEARVEAVGDGFVDELRLEPVPPGAVLRVTFQGRAVDPRVTTLADPPRLVLDLRRPDEDEARGRKPPAPALLRTIVLDAGHGGHDSGAVGPTGLMEKDLVLDITRRVARLVESELGVKVLLTRDGDYFVPLRERTSFANRERADLFVSIHANAHPHASWAGVETYFLSSEATDSEARRVAALENSVVQLERPAAGGRANDVVKAILWDLAQSAFQWESSRLAEIVQDSITRSLRIPNRGVKQAGFYVLGGAAMPAILIEVGFVSNPAEERRLRDSRYRDEIARAIANGIAEYKRQWDQAARADGRAR